MCLAFLARNCCEEVPLLLTFNRDEDFDRPTATGHWWSDAPHVFGGRDLLKGGTWAGVTRSGRFAMLTFVRGPRESITPRYTRGMLAADWLRGTETPKEFLDRVSAFPEDYLGYNLIIGDVHHAFHYSNHSKCVTTLSDGLHGVSNADLNTPWFKVKRGLVGLDALLTQKNFEPDAYYALMRDNTLAPDAEVQVTGLSAAREKLKSALFISLPDYGTRSTTVVFFHRDGTVDFYERGFSPAGEVVSDMSVHFCRDTL